MLVPCGMAKSLIEIALVLLIGATGCKSQWLAETKVETQQDQGNATCSSDELNHSILVECDQELFCKGDQTTGAESSKREYAFNLVHVSSSRDGDRLKIEPIEVFNFEENDFERSFNVNTTLTVFTRQQSPAHKVKGFGATLDLADLMRCFQDGVFERNYKQIISDLFGPFGARFTTLRLVLTPKTVANSDLGSLIERLDQLFVAVGVKSEIELLLDLETMEWSAEVTETLTSIKKKLDSVKAIKSLTLANNSRILSNYPPTSAINSANETEIGLSVDTAHRVGSLVDAANFVDSLSIVERKDLNKIIVQTGTSTPYNTLDHLRQSGEYDIITLAQPRPETSIPGDWQNAKDYAVEIMNLLKHGSNGVIESLSAICLLDRSDKDQDASLYSLHQNYGTYLRGPMFYSISHFSRYLPKGTLLLETSLFTQPNMFAAQYSAFLTPSNDIVTIVLNDNDHLLPFRVSVDGVIKIYTGLKPKSFNTFVLKR